MKWIKCSEKLPKPHKDVLFWYDGIAHVGYLYLDTTGLYGLEWQSYVDGYNCVHDVNFWYPIPEDPEEIE